MNDYISRQAAIKALSIYIHNVDRVIGTGKLSPLDCDGAARSVLDGLPSADAVEVVRCKDCCFYRPKENNCRAWFNQHRRRNDFCSEGMRKDGERNEAD